jgi:hypothetical protein
LKCVRLVRASRHGSAVVVRWINGADLFEFAAVACWAARRQLP